MKTILLLSRSYPPHAGGVAKAAHDLAFMFSALGYRVVVATSYWKMEPTFPVNLPNVEVVPIFQPGAAIGLGERESFSDLVQRVRPCVVVLNANWASKDRRSFVKWLLQAFNVPVVYRSHGFNTSFRFFWRQPPFFGLFTTICSFWNVFKWERFASRFSRCVYLGAQKGFFHNFDRLLASLFHPKTVLDLPNTFSSLDTYMVEPFFQRDEGGGPRFVMVAMPGDVKNQLGVIRVFRRFESPSARLALVMSSRNSYAKRCEELAHGDARISFHYSLLRNRVIDSIRDSDALVLFSKQEQQPIVLLEAMSCGKPWICPKLGNVGTLAGGIVIGRGNERAFLNALTLLANPEERARLGREGKALWDRMYSPVVVHEQWKALLQDVEMVGALPEEECFSKAVETLIGIETVWNPDRIPFREISDPEKLVVNPRISILCTSYNHRRQIEQALQSILSQKSNIPYEIIIGENGSTDGSMDWCVAFQQEHPDAVRILTSDENIGLTGNTLRCLAAARAPYSAFLEVDDYWIDSQKLDKQVRALDRDPGVGFIFSNARIVTDSGTPVRSFYSDIRSEVFRKTDNLVRDLLEGRVSIVTSSVVFRTNLLRELVREYPSVYCRARRTMDIQMWTGLASKSGWKFLAEETTAYRWSVNSVTRTTDHLKRLCFIGEIFSIDSELNRIINGGDPVTARRIEEAATRGVLWSACASGRHDIVSLASAVRHRRRFATRFTERFIIFASRFRVPTIFVRIILKFRGTIRMIFGRHSADKGKATAPTV